MRAPAPRVALVALAVALFAAGLAVIAIRSGDGGGGKLRASATTSTSPTITIAPDTSTSAAPTTTRPVPPALQQTFSQIQDQVAQLRGLPWLAPLDIKALPEADFLREFNAANQRDIHPDRLQGDGDTLKLLKLIPQSADYVKAYYALLNAAVLGFYDPKTTKLFVRANGATLTPLQRITVAHEMDH